MNCRSTDNYLYGTICHCVSGSEGRKRIFGHLEEYKKCFDFVKYDTIFYLEHLTEHFKLCKCLLDELENGFEVLIPGSWSYNKK